MATMTSKHCLHNVIRIDSNLVSLIEQGSKFEKVHCYLIKLSVLDAELPCIVLLYSKYSKIANAM